MSHLGSDRPDLSLLRWLAARDHTATSIVTFRMVFLIQRAQNKESKAVQLKLNEIAVAVQGASNRLIGVESLSEDEPRIFPKHYLHLVRLTEKETDILKSVSVEEAQPPRKKGTVSGP